MERKKPDVDVVKEILRIAGEARPDSSFLRSIALQYEERGGLSKKQLQGLYSKASKIDSVPPQKLATLEAIILRRPTRFKSTNPQPAPLYQRDERPGRLIGEILAKFPQHKRVLFLQARYQNNEPLSATELAELEKFHKLLA